MKLHDRTILITGGSSGIGLALATQLSQRGNTVIITGRDPRALARAVERVPGLQTLVCDVADPQAIEQLCDQVLARFPLLNVLINNAGIMRNIDLRQPHELQQITEEIQINLMGPVRMIQQLLPHLSQRPGALIVNVSSGLAYVPLPMAPIYCATKAALHLYTQSLRGQLRGSRVAVVELAPPAVDTPLISKEFAREMDGQKLMDVDTLAGKAIAGIEAGKQEIRPGLARVLSLMSRLAPALMLRQMTKMAVSPVP